MGRGDGIMAGTMVGTIRADRGIRERGDIIGNIGGRGEVRRMR